MLMRAAAKSNSQQCVLVFFFSSFDVMVIYHGPSCIGVSVFWSFGSSLEYIFVIILV